MQCMKNRIRLPFNVWAGITGGCLTGPYLIPERLDVRKYLIFLQEVLPELLVDEIRQRMWFQDDEALITLNEKLGSI